MHATANAAVRPAGVPEQPAPPARPPASHACHRHLLKSMSQVDPHACMPYVGVSGYSGCRSQMPWSRVSQDYSLQGCMHHQFTVHARQAGTSWRPCVCAGPAALTRLRTRTSSRCKLCAIACSSSSSTSPRAGQGRAGPDWVRPIGPIRFGIDLTLMMHVLRPAATADEPYSVLPTATQLAERPGQARPVPCNASQYPFQFSCNPQKPDLARARSAQSILILAIAAPENATLVMRPKCALRVRRCAPLGQSHMQALKSSAAGHRGYQMALASYASTRMVNNMPLASNDM